MSLGYSDLRKGRHSLAGQIYLVTFTTAARRRHFSEWPVASDAARWLSSPAAWPNANLLAWVLMPDHWHGLIELRGNESLSACVGRCKGRSARALRLCHPWLGPIWSDGFHDRALRDSDGIASAARYVVMNPVRAGLAESVRDYPFWNAIWF